MRDTGSTWKKSRRLNYSILETGEELRKRPYWPGQHGQARRRASEHGKQLMEKQKLRHTYGVNERQFKRLFLLAKKNKEVVTGLAFIQILESRLDNIVFRLGIASTRKQARQLVNHGHIEVDGKKVDIPSFLVPVGSTVGVRENSRDLKIIKFNLEKVERTVPFVTLNAEKMNGTFDRLPERNEVAQDIQENLIIEFYNRQL